jgi:hypothetical protein
MIGGTDIGLERLQLRERWAALTQNPAPLASGKRDVIISFHPSAIPDKGRLMDENKKDNNVLNITQNKRQSLIIIENIADVLFLKCGSFCARRTIYIS